MDPLALWRSLPARPSQATDAQRRAALDLLCFLVDPEDDHDREIVGRCHAVLTRALDRLED